MDMVQTWDRALTARRNQSRHFELILGMRQKAQAKGADFIVVNETPRPQEPLRPMAAMAAPSISNQSISATSFALGV